MTEYTADKPKMYRDGRKRDVYRLLCCGTTGIEHNPGCYYPILAEMLAAGRKLDDPDAYLCPERCGRLTDDPYGGPCSACWCRIQDAE